MIKNVIAAIFLSCSGLANAQNDPTVMTINSVPVSRSEFEYSYNKNNGEGVIDKKTVADYVDMFINYKLKVIAAKELKLDTLDSFKKEFASYRDQQIRPTIIDDLDIERESRKIYDDACTRIDSLGGLTKAYHILVMLNQNASKEQQSKAKVRVDSLYNALLKGAAFKDVALKYSDDKGSAEKGGELPWASKGQFVPDFEKVLYATSNGKISKPFLSPYGYHIVMMKKKNVPFEKVYPYESQKKDIMKFIDMRNLRERIIDEKINSISKKENISPESVLENKCKDLTANDSNLKYLIQEYYDGLLLFEISNREVWDKAAKDDAALKHFFDKNKKKYKWNEPRFRGIAYKTRSAEDIKMVRNVLKGIPFVEWADCLRKKVNNDSVRVQVEKGIFKKGDNALVDKYVFDKDTTCASTKDFPYMAVYGKKIKSPKEMQDVRSQVVADYQDVLEKAWVEKLRKKYRIEIYRDVLDTVNKH
jgi:peptidyl-prolyl cis-trans isomerase SurA